MMGGCIFDILRSCAFGAFTSDAVILEYCIITQRQNGNVLRKLLSITKCIFYFVYKELIEMLLCGCCSE